MEKKFILTDKFVINSFGIKLFQINVQNLSNMPKKVILEDMLRKNGT